METRRAAVVVCAGALAVGCGSHHPDLGSDPNWGEGFSARTSDPTDPGVPASAAQACAEFGGEPYTFPSFDDLERKLAKNWTACGDNPAVEGGFWPSHFAGVHLDGAGTWQALVRASDGSVHPATSWGGEYRLLQYMAGTSPQYAPVFIIGFFAGPAPESGFDGGEVWQGYLEESPEILDFVVNRTGDELRFSSAAP